MVAFDALKGILTRSTALCRIDIDKYAQFESFIKLCDEVDMIRKYIVLNYIAVIKVSWIVLGIVLWSSVRR